MTISRSPEEPPTCTTPCALMSQVKSAPSSDWRSPSTATWSPTNQSTAATVTRQPGLMTCHFCTGAPPDTNKAQPGNGYTQGEPWVKPTPQP